MFVAEKAGVVKVVTPGSAPQATTLLDFLDEGGYSREFVDRLIVPQASAVWSTDPRDLRSFPASLLAEFFDNHGMFGFTGRPNWRAVAGGSSRYVERLTALVEGLSERRISGSITREASAGRWWGTCTSPTTSALRFPPAARAQAAGGALSEAARRGLPHRCRPP